MFLSLINESLVNFALISALNLAILDLNNSLDIEKRLFFGWFIIFSNLGLMYTLLITTIIKIISMRPFTIFCCKRKTARIQAQEQD